MDDKSYVANYNYALSYLKLGQKETAIEALKRALSQVPENEKNEENAIYLSILSALAFLVIENKDFESVARNVEEGLAVKKDHADLLFMKTLLLMNLRRFDEMLETIIHYLLALEEKGAEKFNYGYAHEGAVKEIYNNLLPMAYKCAFEHAQIREIVHKLYKSAGSEGLKRAYDLMVEIDSTRSEKEN